MIDNRITDTVRLNMSFTNSASHQAHHTFIVVIFRNKIRNLQSIKEALYIPLSKKQCTGFVLSQLRRTILSLLARLFVRLFWPHKCVPRYIWFYSVALLHFVLPAFRAKLTLLGASTNLYKSPSLRPAISSPSVPSGCFFKYRVTDSTFYKVSVRPSVRSSIGALPFFDEVFLVFLYSRTWM